MSYVVAAPPDSASRNWKRVYQPIAEPLAAVDALLRDELQDSDPFVDQLVKHAFRLGGKRLRPALLLLAAQASGAIGAEHVVLGAVVEMIHTATLVHDDVLDEATLRRHRETVNARRGNEASVLVGDYLFTHAFTLASSLKTTMACQTIGRSTNIVCAGEMRQIASRGNFELSEVEYLEIIEAKTAEPVLRSPHVDKKSREQFEVRTHKRVLDILEPKAQTIDALMKLDLAAGVDVSIKLFN